MRFIFIVLFLISFGSVSMGGVGDVYYCATNSFVTSGTDKKESLYKNQKFSFKWDKEKIIFGKSENFFENSNFFITKDYSS